MKIGDKAKVVDKESLLYNKTVELIEVNDDAYIFYFEPKKLNLMVRKDVIQKTIKWEPSPDRAKINESKSGTLYGCPGCEKVCNEEEKNTCPSNKMEQVAAMFGKKLYERFTVRYDNHLFDCQFGEHGFVTYDAYENPYFDFDTFILQDLLAGRAVIVNE